MKPQNKDIAKLILLINHAAKTYQEVSSKHADNHLELFFDELTKNHEVFLKQAGGDYSISGELPKNQVTNEFILNKDSAIDQLILCKDMEKAILNQARQAVHNNGFKGKEKKLVCQQLTFSEKALFKADQMLEIYE